MKLIIGISIVTAAHLPFLNIPSVLFLLHLGLISTLYNVPEKRKGIIHLPLRSIPALKIFLIAYVWSAMSSFLPSILEEEVVFTSKTIMVFLANFLFILAITLPFDIRDYATDNKKMLITFPKIIGIHLTKILALICMTGFILISQHMLSGLYIYGFGLLTGTLIIFSSTDKEDYYYTFFLDGTLILYFFTIVLSLA